MRLALGGASRGAASVHRLRLANVEVKDRGPPGPMRAAVAAWKPTVVHTVYETTTDVCSIERRLAAPTAVTAHAEVSGSTARTLAQKASASAAVKDATV